MKSWIGGAGIDEDHRRTGQHPFGDQTEFCQNGEHKLFVKRPRQEEKNELLQCHFDGLRVGPSTQWASPLLPHPKRISGRWILVPFGETFSQTNVLYFARINVVGPYLPEFGGSTASPPPPAPRHGRL